MIEIIWEFVVKEEARGQFELAYGPGGAWSDLFARCPGFRGTTVLRNMENPRRYLTIDLWDTLSQREEWLAEHKAQQAGLEAAFNEWTDSRSAVGTFRVLGEATVKPHAIARRAKGGKAGRRSRRGPR
jgi:heme-degrading monooxygenase HmoA